MEVHVRFLEVVLGSLGVVFVLYAARASKRDWVVCHAAEPDVRPMSGKVSQGDTIFRGASLCEGLQIHGCPMIVPNSAIRVSPGWSHFGVRLRGVGGEAWSPDLRDGSHLDGWLTLMDAIRYSRGSTVYIV